MDPFDYSEKLRSRKLSPQKTNARRRQQQAIDERYQSPNEELRRQQAVKERYQKPTEEQRRQPADDERYQQPTNERRRQQALDDRQTKDKFDFRTIVNPPSPVPISEYQQPNEMVPPASKQAPEPRFVPEPTPVSVPTSVSAPATVSVPARMGTTTNNVTESADYNQPSAISVGDNSLCFNINQSPMLLKILLFFRAVQEYFVVNRDFILTILLCLVLLWILNPFKRVYQCVNRLFGFGGDWCSEPTNKVEAVKKKTTSTKSKKTTCSPKKQSKPSKPKASCVAYVKKGAIFNAKTQLCSK